MRPALPAFLIGCAALSATAGSARAQLESREAISLQNQILELRHELEQSQGGGGPAAAPISGRGGSGDQAGADIGGIAPQLLDRVQTLEGQVRDLRGELDQLSNQVQQQNAALAKQIGDMNFALQQGHGGVPAVSGGDASGVPDQGAEPVPAPGPTPPAFAAVRPVPPPVVHRTPEASLAAGNVALARHDYAGAALAAHDVLSGPRGPRQIDAQFLLGQALAGQRQYQQAAVAYYDAYNRSPRSGRAPDALLGVSASLLALGDKSAACQALAKLHAEFPAPAPRARNAYFALRGRGGCP